MRTITYFVVVFTLAFISLNNANAQTKPGVVPDPRLYECFDSSFIKITYDRSPEGILYYNYYLDHAYFTGTSDPDKPTKDAIDIYTVKAMDFKNSSKTVYFNEDLKSFDPTKFNVLKYSFATDFNDYVTYKLGPTDKLLIFYPVSVFQKKFNEYKKSLGF